MTEGSPGDNPGVCLDSLKLGEGNPDDTTIDGARMLAYKSFGGLLFVLKKYQGLLLPIDLEEFGAYNGAVFDQVGFNLVLGDVLGKCRDMDHFCR